MAADNLRKVANYCVFLCKNSKHCGGVAEGLCAWADSRIRRVVRMVRKLGA